ncbi:thioredoxin domain-containing protein [Salinibacterium sp. G-O1]|uniref:DsbA family protein n=1 Tax=Salinibacterium sp. G-O1 TaxID=3046208 RepID=UPI0024B954AA|nr:thioredoxin domain-containing protein [Salinibacterium sp. G-O1]MDJ0336045.1 thioredoxin domain-containing protein [Salinibacterium sp. G-O1]
MSNVTPGDGRLSKNEKREAARDKARILRESQKKKDRRTKVLLQGGIIFASLAIVAIIALVIVNSVRPVGPGPRNMASDGILISEGFVAAESAALKSDDEPIPNERDEASGALAIQMYVDYLCPICGDFEATNGEYISSLVENGKTTVEIHPITILDRLSQGTKYSTRSANATACVANYSPDNFYDFHNLLFANQPAENSSGLDNDELIALTKEAGVKSASSIESCIKDQEFKSWVNASTARALNGPIPNSNIDKVEGTPTVLVNGLKYEGSVSDLASFQAFVLQATGADFNEQSTPTPTPTATPAG